MYIITHSQKTIKFVVHSWDLLETSNETSRRMLLVARNYMYMVYRCINNSSGLVLVLIRHVDANWACWTLHGLLG